MFDVYGFRQLPLILSIVLFICQPPRRSSSPFLQFFAQIRKCLLTGSVVQCFPWAWQAVGLFPAGSYRSLSKWSPLPPCLECSNQGWNWGVWSPNDTREFHDCWPALPQGMMPPNKGVNFKSFVMGRSVWLTLIWPFLWPAPLNEMFNVWLSYSACMLNLLACAFSDGGDLTTSVLVLLLQEASTDHPLVLNKVPFEHSSSQHSLTLKSLALGGFGNYSTASKNINSCQTFQHVECVQVYNITVHNLLHTLQLFQSSYLPE